MARRRVVPEASGHRRQKQDNRDGQVDDEAGQERGHLAQREAGLRDDPVRDAAVDAYRREASALRPVDDH